ncbi:MAG: hypothetical protein L3K06_00065 [Thermoplasmata archaeon]|nr:hypothetical protein [Thermoplasmata archaeon]
MSALIMDASIALAVVAIALAGTLVALYRRIYAQSRTSFGLALIIFAAAFVLQSCLLVYSYVAMMPLIPDSIAPFLFTIGLCEATGLSAVVWTASR